jgi:eukaryotic-like serine/threonine-protein kinase
MTRLINIFFLLIFSSEIFCQSGAGEWPVFRGKSDLAGRFESDPPASLQLLWSVSTGARTKSSPVISDGNIYFGNEKGELVAITPEGKIKWKYSTGSPIEAAPLIYGSKVIVGTSEGSLKAVDKNRELSSGPIKLITRLQDLLIFGCQVIREE